MQIWIEGYRVTGNADGARCLGEAPGATLKEACANFAKINPVFRADFNARQMTYWGCRIFDNEADARKQFG